MKVCLINNLYPPYARGGAEQVVVKTVQGLLAAGHEVVVITATPEGQHLWQEGKLTIYRYHPRNIYFYTEADEHHWPSRWLWHLLDIINVRAADYVERILEREKPDVVHTHNLMGIGFLLPRTIRRLGLRHVHTVHDVQLVEPSGIILKAKETSRRYTGRLVQMYTALMKWLFNSPNVVISPSQFLLDFYEKRGFFPKSNRVLLRNPAPAPEPRSNSPRIGLLRFLYVGQIEEHKGVLFLVEAFRSANIQAELHIVGTGTQMDHLQSLAQGNDRIIVHGKVEREKLPEIFRQADVTIVPSLCYENSPTVIFESFAFGVPVLASRVEGIAELIQEGENGLTFETGNAESLQEKLRWCAEHAPELEQMRKNTERSLVGLGEGDYIERLLELYRS